MQELNWIEWLRTHTEKHSVTLQSIFDFPEEMLQISQDHHHNTVKDANWVQSDSSWTASADTKETFDYPSRFLHR